MAEHELGDSMADLEIPEGELASVAAALADSEDVSAALGNLGDVAAGGAGAMPGSQSAQRSARAGQAVDWRATEFVRRVHLIRCDIEDADGAFMALDQYHEQEFAASPDGPQRPA